MSGSAAATAGRTNPGQDPPSTSSAAVTIGNATFTSGSGRPMSVAEMLQKHHQQDFGLSRVVGVAATWPAAGSATANASQVDLAVSLTCLLPSALPISGVEVTLADDLVSRVHGFISWILGLNVLKACLISSRL